MSQRPPSFGPTKCASWHHGQTSPGPAQRKRFPSLLSLLPGLDWSLSIHDQLVSTTPCLAILDHLSFQSAMPYWIYKGPLLEASVWFVNWKILGKALLSLPPTYHMWLSKFASRHSAVSVTMAHWKKWTSPICPICHLSNEDMDHVFLCPNTECMACWHYLTDTLQQWFFDTNTHPAISRCILTTLHSCGTISFFAHTWSICCWAAAEQDQIDFFGILLWHLSTQWGMAQTAFAQQQGFSCSPLHWSRGLCLQLLHLSHKMWLFCSQQIQSALLLAQSQELETSIN